jgi:hypothetical protein
LRQKGELVLLRSETPAASLLAGRPLVVQAAVEADAQTKNVD